MTPTERGERAEQLLRDPVLKEAFAALREKLVSRLEQVPMTDYDTQHEAVIALQVLKSLNSQLLSFKNDALVVKDRQKHTKWLEKVKQSLHYP